MKPAVRRIVLDALAAFLSGLVIVAILAVVFTINDGAFPAGLVSAWALGVGIGTLVFVIYRLAVRSRS